MSILNKFSRRTLLIIATFAVAYGVMVIAPDFVNAQTSVQPQISAPASDFREVDPENVIVMDTTKGRIIIELATQLAPLHSARIKDLARAHFYDGLTFHRVIDGFMAQGGDPKGDGTGGSDLPDLPAEFTLRRDANFPYVKALDIGAVSVGYVGSFPVTSQADTLFNITADHKVAIWGNHCPAITSMARAGDPNSANSQFFLMREYSRSLDRQYTVWGRALVGLDIIRSIKTGEPVINPDKMTSVQVLADIPAAMRPKIKVQRTDSPSFRASIEQAIARDGTNFSNCSVVPQVQVQ